MGGLNRYEFGQLCNCTQLLGTLLLHDLVDKLILVLISENWQTMGGPTY